MYMNEVYNELKQLGYPHFKSKEEQIDHVDKMINVGAIPVHDLEIGCTYQGICRNSSTAVWDGEKFTYIRYKFGFTYPEEIEHFENETEGYDAFIPYKKLD